MIQEPSGAQNAVGVGRNEDEVTVTLPTIPKPDMLPSEYLRRGWCQRNLATDAKGLGTAPWDAAAVAWCVVGAYGGARPLVWGTALAQITDEPSSALWNDAQGRTQAEVIGVAEAAERALGWREDK